MKPGPFLHIQFDVHMKLSWIVFLVLELLFFLVFFRHNQLEQLKLWFDLKGMFSSNSQLREAERDSFMGEKALLLSIYFQVDIVLKMKYQNWSQSRRKKIIFTESEAGFRPWSEFKSMSSGLLVTECPFYTSASLFYSFYWLLTKLSKVHRT